MTKKEFKHDMQRGLGSCMVELKRTPDINRYRDIILWGCNHELAYDAQCEGTRSWYLYQMIWMYEDWSPFFEAVHSGMKRCCSRSGWEFMQHAELCALMAGGGYESAEQVLNDMYDYLLERLMQRKKHPKNGAVPEEKNMEALCIVKTVYQYEDKKDLEKEYIRIVHDLGRLFGQREGLYSFAGFSWFQAECEDDIGEAGIKRLLKAYAGQEEVAIYRKSMEEVKNKLFSKSEKKYPAAAEEVYERIKVGEKVGIGKDIPSYMWMIWKNQEKQEEFRNLAERYEKEQEEGIRAELLKLFWNCSCAGLLDVDILIRDTRSQTEALQENAYRALTYVKSEKVREYGLELLGEEKCNALSMLLRNYDVRDKDIIIREIQTIPVSRKERDWHRVFRNAMELFRDPAVKKPPKELLTYMYRNTLCSECREFIVTEMGRRRMLTPELAEECQYDCNYEIRKYGERKIRNRVANAQKYGGNT